MKASASQPWIGKSWIDILFILLPSFVSLLLVFLFPSVFQQQDGLSDAWWVVLILLIDVAHVYSTLYRTYFDKEAYKEQRTKLLLIPFVSFVLMVLMYSQSALFFWRILAYTAVFHFVRQQYGFMRLYSRKEMASVVNRKIDAITIYSSTIYPLLYWHLSGNRNFNWFVEGDFIQLSFAASLLNIAAVLYLVILFTYLIKEIVFTYQSGAFNIPRNMVVAGTAASWYFGIVYFNGDMAFTLLNVVSHGVPYMALIWLYGKKKEDQFYKKGDKLMQLIFSRYGLFLFLGIIFLLAFLEEGLWDITLWKEHTQVFSIFHFTNTRLSNGALSVIVPLLALPQVTHYIIDGFIWRIRKEVPGSLLSNEALPAAHHSSST